MAPSAEKFDKKKVLIAAAGIALGAAALRKNKIVGEKLYSVGVWGENTLIVVADIVDDGMGRAKRIGGKLILSSSGEVEDVEIDDSEEELPSETQEQFTRVFIEADWDNNS